MIEPKFTPGRWHVEDNGLCVSDSNRVVLFLSDRPYEDETNRADTALIAAAPEMYVVLNRLLIEGAHTGLFDEIEPLLRKARGESEVSE